MQVESYGLNVILVMPSRQKVEVAPDIEEELDGFRVSGYLNGTYVPREFYSTSLTRAVSLFATYTMKSGKSWEFDAVHEGISYYKPME